MGGLMSRKEAQEKGLTQFFTGRPCRRGHIAVRSTSGGMCRECEVLRDRARLEYKKELGRKRYAEDPEYRERIAARDARYRLNNSEALAEKVKIKYQATSEHQKEKAAKWYQANKDRANSRAAERYKANPAKFLIRSLVRQTLLKVKQKKTARSHMLLGYGPLELKNHIEKQFKDGMSWDNPGEWHVDHIKPIHQFILEGIGDPKVINALSNLQPLWAHENLSKKAKWEE